MSNKRIWLSSPHLGDKEREFVQEAFDTNWVSPLGPNVNGFEEDIAKYLGGDVQVAALSSGTAALHLALVILGVQHGDEVICQSMTFSASANPIVYQGATPVFVDSEGETWNMSPYWLEEAIKDRLSRGKKPKAIIPVHLYGMPAKMNEISLIAASYNIPIIEDAAEALGSSYFGKKMGVFGEMSILSFNGNKIITTSGGGALISKKKEDIEKARFLATQARDPAPHYEHSHIGYNYRLSNISAGIGRGQMVVLDERVKRRREVFARYWDCLKHYGICTQKELQGMFSNRWLTAIVLEPAGIINNKLREELAKQDIESRPLWKPMHLQPVFKDAPFYGDGTSEILFIKGLCLPSGSNMSEEELDTVIEKIKEVL